MNKSARYQQRTSSDTLIELPIRDTNPVDIEDLIDINLKKSIYGAKEALLNLDEEFKFFAPKSYSSKYFFSLYNKNFYSFSREFHTSIIRQSTNYAYPEGYINPRVIEQNDLQKDIKDVQRSIDSLEREHFFFKNRTFLMNDAYKTDPESILATGRDIYYMHSAKKREVRDYQTYLNLKTQLTKGQGVIDDRNFINFVSKTTLDKIPSGPHIFNLNDSYRDPFEINIYPQTIQEYEAEGEIIEEPENRNEVTEPTGTRP